MKKNISDILASVFEKGDHVAVEEAEEAPLIGNNLKTHLAALEKQTLSAVVGNWAKAAGWVAAIIAALTVAGPPLLAFLQAVIHAK